MVLFVCRSLQASIIQTMEATQATPQEEQPETVEETFVAAEKLTAVSN